MLHHLLTRLIRLMTPTLAALAALCLPLAGLADNHASGFLDDIEQLNPVDDAWISYAYFAPGFDDKVAAAQSIMVDQPEIHIAEDSPYKGVKPDDMKLLSDTYREFAAEALSELYEIADAPGPNTLYLRMGFTKVSLRKKGRGLLGYTPIGFVAGTAKRVLLDEFTDKVLLTEGAIEVELLDSLTTERIGAVIITLSDDRNGENFANWEQLENAMAISAARLRCRFENAGLPEAEWQDCTEITEI